jgi:SAM-dependent methyltransferase
LHWKLKAAFQQAVSLLPSSASFELYYRVQRACGTLREVNPIEGFENGVRLLNAAEAAGGNVRDKTVLEVGTGRRLNVPITLWLCGAAKTITVDLNRYLKPGLILEDIEFLRHNPAAIDTVFGARARSDEFQRRLALLLRRDLDVATLCELAGIRYLAPHDAARLPLANGSIDWHVSNNVLEHIAPDVMGDILLEGRRVVRQDGLLIHRVDFSDHFSEVDARITTVNFLRYSERQWRWYAGNRYNYHNRLRIDELESIVRAAGLEVVLQLAEVDPVAMRLLESGFKLDARFAEKSNEVNATQTAVVVLAPRSLSPNGKLAATRQAPQVSRVS